MDLRSACLLFACLIALPFHAQAIEHTDDALATVKQSVTEKTAVLVDVREQSEWDRGHIAGAEFLPLSDLRNGIKPDALQKKLPKERIIYTHCAVGKRSLIAAEILQKHGYDVRPLKAGYADLLRAGFPKAGK